ncbi:MAG: universal stress protein [Haloferacaceae archaeon]
MTTFVVGAGSVHASAALCDYLDGRLDDGDTVHAAAWVAGAGAEATRDAADALNGVRSRLGVRASVETHRLGGEKEDGDGATGADDVGTALLPLAERTDADELVVGSGADGLAPEDVADLVAGTTRPVVAVPLG